jgi:hypothetical protein
MPITTAMCTSFKAELLQGMHCLTATLTPTGDVLSANQTISNISSIANICRGMPITAAQLAAGSYVENIPTASSITVSRTALSTQAGATLTIAGDAIKMALVKATPSGTYGAASTNYANITSAGDEVTGTGYTAGGTALGNVTPTISGTVALTTFSPNPSWAGATFSTSGCMIYNSSTRGGTSGRAISCHDFGGTQSVSGGTFTIIMPSADAANAILRLQ